MIKLAEYLPRKEDRSALKKMCEFWKAQHFQILDKNKVVLKVDLKGAYDR